MVTRCCQTCRWFRADADGKRGLCTNPAMTAEVGLQLDVHQRELRCRIGWDADRWEAAHEDRILDIRWRNSDRATNDYEPISQPLSAGEIEGEGNKRHATPLSGLDAVLATEMMID